MDVSAPNSPQHFFERHRIRRQRNLTVTLQNLTHQGHHVLNKTEDTVQGVSLAAVATEGILIFRKHFIFYTSYRYSSGTVTESRVN